MTTPKVLIIGLDAASIDFILASLPSLPNLTRLIASGSLRRLRSTTSELLPAACWSTLYTGVPPGVHGVYYHLQWNAEAMRLRRSATGCTGSHSGASWNGAEFVS